MSGYKDEFDTLARFFSDEWAGRTPIAYSNVSYTPVLNQSWVRFSIQNGESLQASIGTPHSNYFRYMGVVFVQVFAAINTGELPCRELADEVVNIFDTARGSNALDGYMLSPANIDISPAITGDTWFQITVKIPFMRDILK